MVQFYEILQVLISLFISIATAGNSAVAEMCATSFSKIGCFVDRRRPLPQLLLNEREHIDWEHWDEFLDALVCNCANLAAASGFSYFGIQYWGECWGGENPEVTYDADGQSDLCYGRDFLPCDTGSANCAGAKGVNFVYKLSIQNTPPGATSNGFQSPHACGDIDPTSCLEFKDYCEDYLNIAENCPKTCDLC